MRRNLKKHLELFTVLRHVEEATIGWMRLDDLLFWHRHLKKVGGAARCGTGIPLNRLLVENRCPLSGSHAPSPADAMSRPTCGNGGCHCALRSIVFPRRWANHRIRMLLRYLQKLIIKHYTLLHEYRTSIQCQANGPTATCGLYGFSFRSLIAILGGLDSISSIDARSVTIEK